MTRKKFIKMLMWAGMSRNDAADAATLAQDAERPYFYVLGDLLCFNRPHFGDPLAWLKIRHTIIHGRNTPVGRLYARLDEASDMKNDAVYQALVAGVGKKRDTVIITTHSPPLPDSLYRQIVEHVRQTPPDKLAAELPDPGLWPKKNPHRPDMLPALILGRGNSRNAVGTDGLTFHTMLVDELHDPAAYGGGGNE